MKAIDTNVLTRFLMRDEPAQAKAARRLVLSGCIVTPTVLLETAWVLRGAYGFDDIEVAGMYRDLSRVPEVQFAEAPLVDEALRLTEAGVDFADAMHTATCPADQLRTFDKDFVKRAKKAKSKVVVEGA